jgi:hypothetical protein
MSIHLAGIGPTPGTRLGLNPNGLMRRFLNSLGICYAIPIARSRSPDPHPQHFQIAFIAGSQKHDCRRNLPHNQLIRVLMTLYAVQHLREFPSSISSSIYGHTPYTPLA